MKDLLTHRDFNDTNISDLFMNTKSNLSKTGDKNWCQYTSIFRSYMGEIKHISVGEFENDKIYGTVSNFVVTNFESNTKVNLRVLDSLDALKNGDQMVTYKELNSTLDSLFAEKV